MTRALTAADPSALALAPRAPRWSDLDHRPGGWSLQRLAPARSPNAVRGRQSQHPLFFVSRATSWPLCAVLPVGTARRRYPTLQRSRAATDCHSTRSRPISRESATHRHFGSAKVRESFERYGFSLCNGAERLPADTVDPRGLKKPPAARPARRRSAPSWSRSSASTRKPL
jgi:hypothetical protein